VASRWCTCSRSTIKQPNAASTNIARKMSSIPMRDCTWLTPSAMSSTPAIPPNKVERVIRRTIRTMSNTQTVPASAAEIRHPQLS
jgi:hypothetical protein